MFGLFVVTGLVGLQQVPGNAFSELHELPRVVGAWLVDFKKSCPIAPAVDPVAPKASRAAEVSELGMAEHNARDLSWHADEVFCCLSVPVSHGVYRSVKEHA
uniref:Uncharacterized protein n=1 Tax=Burkholderia sp. M701 TaxID=326454 RepID=V5YNQ1_9BURK|nr:hypothetical protein [Burkholderia sp. M701]